MALIKFQNREFDLSDVIFISDIKKSGDTGLLCVEILFRGVGPYEVLLQPTDFHEWHHLENPTVKIKDDPERRYKLISGVYKKEDFVEYKNFCADVEALLQAWKALKEKKELRIFRFTPTKDTTVLQEFIVIANTLKGAISFAEHIFKDHWYLFFYSDYRITDHGIFEGQYMCFNVPKKK